MRTHGALAASASLLAFFVAACQTAPASPILSVKFGSDYTGTTVASSLDRGSYEVRVTCQGASRVSIALKSGGTNFQEGEVPCADGSVYRFTLREPVNSEVSFEVDGANAKGSAELYATDGN